MPDFYSCRFVVHLRRYDQAGTQQSDFNHEIHESHEMNAPIRAWRLVPGGRAPGDVERNGHQVGPDIGPRESG